MAQQTGTIASWGSSGRSIGVLVDADLRAGIEELYFTYLQISNGQILIWTGSTSSSFSGGDFSDVWEMSEVALTLVAANGETLVAGGPALGIEGVDETAPYAWIPPIGADAVDAWSAAAIGQAVTWELSDEQNINRSADGDSSTLSLFIGEGEGRQVLNRVGQGEFSAVRLSAGEGAGRFIPIPTSDGDGITVRISTGEGVAVSIPSLVFSSVPTQTGQVGELLSFVLPDPLIGQSPYIYQVTGLPSNLIFFANIRSIRGIPLVPGLFTIRYRVVDSRSAVGNLEFTISISGEIASELERPRDTVEIDVLTSQYRDEFSPKLRSFIRGYGRDY